jgi:hypothetical protein
MEKGSKMKKLKLYLLVFSFLFVFSFLGSLCLADSDLSWTSIPENSLLNFSANALNVKFVANSSTSVDYYLNDTTYFRINKTGVLRNISQTPIGTYRIKVFANDSFNNTIITIYTITIQPLIIKEGAIRIPFLAGWNSFSFPFLPNNTAMHNVFSSINNKFSQVKTQEEDGSIKIWESGIDDAWNDLINIKFSNTYLLNMNQNASLTFYGYANPTSYFYENGSTLWSDVGICNMANDTIIRKREVFAKDLRSIAPDAIIMEQKIFFRDCCSPNWIEGSGICNGNISFTAHYQDTNSCFMQTNLSSDNNPPSPNVYSCSHICSNALGCDYTECSDGYDNDGDGFVDYPEDGGCYSYLDNSESIYFSENLKKGLVGYYNFDSGSNLVNNSNNILPNEGNPVYNYTDCLIGKCGQTWEDNNFKILSNPTMNYRANYTFNFWVRGIDNGRSGYPYFLGSPTNGNNQLGWDNPTNIYATASWTGVGGNIAGSSVTHKKWFMITLMGNTTGYYIFVNGTMLRWGWSTSSSQEDIYIGNIFNKIYDWHGQFDEMGYWKRGLSQSEITDLFNAGNGMTYLPTNTTILAIAQSPEKDIPSINYPPKAIILKKSNSNEAIAQKNQDNFSDQIIQLKQQKSKKEISIWQNLKDIFSALF